MSGGKRALNARSYYARLTQALVTAMTAPMAEGRLYEVDMRLRPSGNRAGCNLVAGFPKLSKGRGVDLGAFGFDPSAGDCRTCGSWR